jgi:hypothetical protein
MGKSRKKEMEFSPECFTVAADVFPPVAMGRENALRLATNLAAHQDLSDIHMSDESWVFRRPQAKGHARGHVEVTVSDQEITIEQRAPGGGLERFEILLEQAIDAIGAAIKPQAIWGSVVTLEYQVNIGSDTRKAILGSLGMLDEDDGPGKLGVFERPCHFVGLRLGFPAFRLIPEGKAGEKKSGGKESGGEEDDDDDLDAGDLMEQIMEEGTGKEGQEKGPPPGAGWHATLTLQSLQDDPNSLSVEVSGRWIVAKPWKDVTQLLSGRLRMVDEFLKTKTKEFLQQFRSEE